MNSATNVDQNGVLLISAKSLKQPEKRGHWGKNKFRIYSLFNTTLRLNLYNTFKDYGAFV